MSDYVEVTRRGLGGRSKDSIGGALFGLLLVLAGTVLLFWNEGRAVKRYKDLKEGAGVVVATTADRIDPATDGKLVHLSGEAVTSAPIADPDFGISVTAIRLERRSEMYQWIEEVHTETKNKTGGGTETVKRYTYDKAWRDRIVDSGNFKVPGGHQNPTSFKFGSGEKVAELVTLGAFTLPDFLVAKIGGAQPLPVETLENASEEVKSTGKLDGGRVYFGKSADAPEIGDVRVGFAFVPTGTVSVVARQSGTTFDSYLTKTGGKVDLLERGVVSAADMFQMAQDRNKILTWAIRVGGFFLLALAFSMILRPIAVLASILPVLGRLAETGIGIVAFLLAGILAALTISVAWIFYRPLLGIAILVVAVVLTVLVVKRFRNRAPAGARPPALADAPPPLT